MQRKLILTGDGSHTISMPELNVTYHSIHGAIQESKHVFIEAGLKSLLPVEGTALNVFEMGFGTGLNALLTIIESERLQRKIYYETVEQFPVDNGEVRSLNYCEQLDREDLQPIFEQLHSCEWEKKVNITENFGFNKSRTNLLNLETSETFELIYFDAFAPNTQPELWTNEIFEKMFAMLEPGGILVTYCSKGDVRRAMQAAGFIVEKLPGPRGKREMTRALR
ncbi:MAG TPA: tRNA (5-methylaminomethyl-2-thiouridine)(34)-methyltransferase MnmD [Chitinophagaceae bacterium]|nr:tRNA (5-methylaminomethyl-2-thiouridine)(34)-methyltransferase MnmD [Chitinophagaceae bacterium]